MPLKLPCSKPLGELEEGREARDYSFFPGSLEKCEQAAEGKCPFHVSSLPDYPPRTPVCVCLSETDLSVENGPGTPSCVWIRSWGTWGGVTLLAYFHIH